jgi:hypothetical protein
MGSKTKTTSRVDPNFAALQPYAQQQLAGTGQFSNVYTPTEAGGIGEAMDMSRRVLGGEFLGSNPYLQGVMDDINADTTRQFTQGALPGVQSGFSQAGRYGSGAMGRSINNAVQGFTKQLGANERNIRMGDYAQERGYQMGQIPQLANLGMQQYGIDIANKRLPLQQMMDYIQLASPIAQNTMYQTKTKSSPLGAIGSAIGGGLGFAFGGPMGGMAGSQMGGGFGNMF